MSDESLISKLDELIAATRSAAIPANMRWLSAESMAAMLDMSPRQFAERLACKPGFPNPRAWIVTKQGMTGDLYDALAWDNGGKPLGVSVNTPVPMYDDAAIREMIVAIQSNREAIEMTVRPRYVSDPRPYDLADAAAILKQHNVWRRWNGDWDEEDGPEPVGPSEIGRAIDMVVTHIEALPKTRASWLQDGAK